MMTWRAHSAEMEDQMSMVGEIPSRSEEQSLQNTITPAPSTSGLVHPMLTSDPLTDSIT